MKNQNEDLDNLLREALTEDEVALFEAYDEQNVFQMIGGLFQGKMKWLNTVTLVVQLIFLGLAVYFAYRFFNAEVLFEMIQFGAGVVLLMLMISMLKLYQFMEMNKNATIREIKRLELQVSLLSSSLKKGMSEGSK